MKCEHPECTGIHRPTSTERWKNLCPRTKELHRATDRRWRMNHYNNLTGYEYSELLLKHRRTKALARKKRRESGTVSLEG